MSENLEDRFQTDQVVTPKEAAARRLRVATYAGGLIALYGLFLKGVVPLTLLLLGGSSEAFFHDASLASLPVGAVAWALLRRDEVGRRAALAAAAAGLAYQLSSAIVLVAHPPARGDFALFSRTYYGIWSSVYFIATLALLARSDVRNLFSASKPVR